MNSFPILEFLLLRKAPKILGLKRNSFQMQTLNPRQRINCLSRQYFYEQRRSFFGFNWKSSTTAVSTNTSSLNASTTAVSTNTSSLNALPSISGTSVDSTLAAAGGNSKVLFDNSNPITIDPSIISNAPNSITIDAITNIGDLHSLGLASYFTPVGWFQNILEITFISTGLSWISTIILATIIVRTLLFPLSILVQKKASELARVKPLVEPLRQKALRLTMKGDRQGAALTNEAMIKVFKQQGVSPFSGLLGFVQIPIFISLFLALKNMAQLPVPGFETGGYGWIMDLSLADPYYILPALAGSSLMASVLMNKEQMKTMQDSHKFGLGVIMLLSFPIFLTFPVAVMIYTLTSAFIQMLQAKAFQNKTVKKWIGLPLVDIVEVKKTPTSLTRTKPITVKQARQQIADFVAKNN